MSSFGAHFRGDRGQQGRKRPTSNVQHPTPNGASEETNHRNGRRFGGATGKCRRNRSTQSVEPPRGRAENRRGTGRFAFTRGQALGFSAAMFEWLTDPQAWISLFTLTVLEIVLGVDNIIFISILAGKLPPEQQGKARTIGLMLALITRILLLSLIFLLTKLVSPLFVVPFLHEHVPSPVHAGETMTRTLEVTGRHLVLFIGGLFLIYKSVKEIHGSLEGEDHAKSAKAKPVFSAIIFQIVVMDIIFSLDSVITAVGMSGNISIMVIAVVAAMGVMLFAAKGISDFVNDHPTIKMLALSFLLMVGLVLVGEGCGQHIEKGYIYTAMGFAFGVELLNMKARKKRGAKPVDLRSEY
jgi:predicted tellurium resistance membrane protein TerC